MFMQNMSTSHTYLWPPYSANSNIQNCRNLSRIFHSNLPNLHICAKHTWKHILQQVTVWNCHTCCSKYPPFTRTQGRRRWRHSSVTLNWLKQLNVPVSLSTLLRTFFERLKPEITVDNTVDWRPVYANFMRNLMNTTMSLWLPFLTENQVFNWWCSRGDGVISVGNWYKESKTANSTFRAIWTQKGLAKQQSLIRNTCIGLLSLYTLHNELFIQVFMLNSVLVRAVLNVWFHTVLWPRVCSAC